MVELFRAWKKAVDLLIGERSYLTSGSLQRHRASMNYMVMRELRVTLVSLAYDNEPRYHSLMKA